MWTLTWVFTFQLPNFLMQSSQHFDLFILEENNVRICLENTGRVKTRVILRTPSARWWHRRCLHYRISFNLLITTSSGCAAAAPTATAGPNSLHITKNIIKIYIRSGDWSARYLAKADDARCSAVHVTHLFFTVVVYLLKSNNNMLSNKYNILEERTRKPECSAVES